MKTLFIIRGPSGAGKGHYIQNHIVKNSSFSQAVVCSADDYFMQEGEYVFDVGKLPQAHSECMYQVLSALMLEHECIVVDNTHTRRWEYRNYELAAKLAGYKVEVIEIVPHSVAEMKVCASRNQHDVPANVIASQVMRFERDSRATVIRGNIEGEAG